MPSSLTLLHLADSALPVGGFAYSFGLECAIRQGLLTQPESVTDYLHTYAEQVISFDFPFVSSAYEMEGFDKAANLFSAYEAMLLNPMVRKANGVMGKNWLKLFCRMYALEELEKRASKEKWSCDLPVIFGICCKQIGISYQESLFLYFYSTLRDQISALIRLGAAGPSWAHNELKNILKNFDNQFYDYQPVPYHEAYKSAYLQEIAQLSHDRVYSKLFQN